MKNYVRSFLNKRAFSQLVKVGVIGVGNTIAYFMFFNVLRLAGVPTVASITISFAATTVMSYLLNRRWSFDIVEGRPSVSEGSRFFVINIVAWAVTVAVVEGADAIFGPLTLVGENLANLVAAAIILLPKFASYRDVVFRGSIAHQREMQAPDARS